MTRGSLRWRAREASRGSRACPTSNRPFIFVRHEFTRGPCMYFFDLESEYYRTSHRMITSVHSVAPRPPHGSQI